MARRGQSGAVRSCGDAPHAHQQQMAPTNLINQMGGTNGKKRGRELAEGGNLEAQKSGTLKGTEDFPLGGAK